MLPLRISDNAASMVIMPELDFGERQSSITAWLKGMRASGKPSLSADSMAAKVR